MGIYDRDYIRRPPRQTGASSPGGSVFGAMRLWSVTTWLLVINIAVFLIDQLILLRILKIGYVRQFGSELVPIGVLEQWGHFSADLAIAKFQVWRFITFQFFHAFPMHIIGNMLMLFFFGRLVERYLGSRRFLAFYLLCGIAGPIAYLLLWATGFLNTTSVTMLVGASAGVFGVLIAAARIAPRAIVLVMGIIPVQLKTLAWFLLGLAIYTVLFFGPQAMHNAGGEAAHIGGALLGLLLISRPHLLDFADRLKPPRKGAPQPGGRSGRSDSTRRKQAAAVDRILAKIKREGIHSLTEEEKEQLKQASR